MSLSFLNGNRGQNSINGFLHEIASPSARLKILLKRLDATVDLDNADPDVAMLAELSDAGDELFWHLERFVAHNMSFLADVFEVETVDLVKCLTQAVNDLPVKEDFKFKLLNDLSGQDVSLVKADPYYLTIAFQDIFYNAYEAIRQNGSGTVKLSLRQMGDSILVSITDTGIVLNDKIEKKLFKRKVSGWNKSGLGLIFCNKVFSLSSAKVTFINEQQSKKVLVRFEV